MLDVVCNTSQSSSRQETPANRILKLGSKSEVACQ